MWRLQIGLKWVKPCECLATHLSRIKWIGILVELVHPNQATNVRHSRETVTLVAFFFIFWCPTTVRTPRHRQDWWDVVSSTPKAPPLVGSPPFNSKVSCVPMLKKCHGLATKLHVTDSCSVRRPRNDPGSSLEFGELVGVYINFGWRTFFSTASKCGEIVLDTYGSNQNYHSLLKNLKVKNDHEVGTLRLPNLKKWKLWAKMHPSWCTQLFTQWLMLKSCAKLKPHITIPMCGPQWA